jgi:RNA polymerase sigma-70 factor (ECF subfamily)
MDRETEREGMVQEALAQVETSAGWLELAYRENSAAVLQTAYRVTGSVEDAEDVLQTVFTRLAGREEPPDLSRGALPYLRRAATNAALDIVQSRHARSSTPLDITPPRLTSDTAPTPERLQLSREMAAALRIALSRLNRRQAEVFVLKYFEDLDHRTIAQQLETSPGTVAVTLHRVRSRLASELRAFMGGRDD